MNTLTVACLLAAMAIATAMPSPSETYTDRFDNIDLDEIIGNRRLLVPYIHCVLDKGKCTPDGKELKSHIKEALENNCGKCTETQKSGSRKVIGHLINNEKEYWGKLTAKYDPERKYVTKYESELRKIAA
ncbi:PREDICTED: ejaculatory bulb-specific protein 3-like isoform X1 [Papilio xuthus]|uniref:Ejaculatory bulb-specific protein 3-like isoform X1 n=1 Tax=Papilio xuthus TaxID=66420 RepID=A0AAJ6Z0K5_PAPXU|nr:PREDICTED: ejaculatory bulb-specific protein 3-like isoform X1 [Papilio xuthus]